jgi:hypothetical protein
MCSTFNLRILTKICRRTRGYTRDGLGNVGREEVPHSRPSQRQVQKRKEKINAEIIEFLRTFALTNPRQGSHSAYLAVLEEGYLHELLRRLIIYGRTQDLEFLFVTARRTSQFAGLFWRPIIRSAPMLPESLSPSFEAIGKGKVLKLLNIVDEYSGGTPGRTCGSID